MKARLLGTHIAILCDDVELEKIAALEAQRNAMVQGLNPRLFGRIEIKGMPLNFLFVAHQCS